MPTPDEELSQLEKDIRQIKIEYEIYLGGGRRRLPADLEWRIEQIIKRYSERGPRLTAMQVFRFNGLVQSYAKVREINRKRVQQKEEGRVTRHFGAAARAVEEQRQGRRAAARPGAVAAAHTEPGAQTGQVPEDLTTSQLYEAFRSAKQRAGESTEQLTLEQFREFVSRKAQQLRAKTGASSVEFVVANEDGRVRLKARVRQAPGKTKPRA